MYVLLRRNATSLILDPRQLVPVLVYWRYHFDTIFLYKYVWSGLKNTFAHTCRLVEDEHATLFGFLFFHTCNPKWTYYQKHGIWILLRLWCRFFLRFFFFLDLVLDRAVLLFSWKNLPECSAKFRSRSRSKFSYFEVEGPTFFKRSTKFRSTPGWRLTEFASWFADWWVRGEALTFLKFHPVPTLVRTSTLS